MRFYILIISFLFVLTSGYSQVKTDFVDELVSADWNIPVGVTFDNTGRAYVWEKNGKVFHFIENAKVELINIEEEVGSWYDNGLNGFALDPEYHTNGYVYLLYVVDRHHLMNYGTSNYDPSTNDYLSASVGRITRYTVLNPLTNPVVDYSSRHILLGSTLSNGFPIVTDNHGVGSLVFGSDGSLLASNGDGANVHVGNSNSPFGVQAREDGILRPDEALNHMRVQDTTSLSGKIIRIDPETGQGLPSNPFYDSSNPNSGQSKVWAYGLRNPFRFTLKPLTGSHYMEDGNPGTFVVGEVGWDTYEEINIMNGPGQNFGWPKYEGMTYEPNFGDFTPSMAGTHKLPIIEIPHVNNLQAKAQISNEIIGFGSENFNYPTTEAVSIIGGIFYNGNNFPEAYKNKYFLGDYNDTGWIKTMDLNDNNEPLNFEAFANDGNSTNPTCFAENPVDGYIYYVRYKYNNINELRRIKYDPIGGNGPNVVVQSSINHGAAPLEVKFYGNLSSDPENDIVSYEWNFDDGTTSNLIDPIHTFTGTDQTIKNVSLKITDQQGNQQSRSIKIYPNNTPPEIVWTSLDNFYVSENTEETFLLDCEATDLETPVANLNYEWVVELVHNEHSHVDAVISSKSSSITLPRTPADNNLYYYRINLSVIDADGLRTNLNRTLFFEKNINQDVLPPNEIANLKYKVIGENIGKIEWDLAADDNGIYLYEIFKNNLKIKDIRDGSNYHYITDQQKEIAATYNIVARDSSGKISGNKYLYFKMTNTNCSTTSEDAETSSCAYTDSTTTQPVQNIIALRDSLGLALTWNPVGDSDFEAYEILLNGKLLDNSSTIPYALLKKGINTIQVQAMDSNNNRITSNNFVYDYTEVLSVLPENPILIYPNPVIDYLTISGINLSEGESNVIVYNLKGQILIKETLKSLTVDIRHLPTGTYIAKVNQGKMTYSITFLK